MKGNGRIRGIRSQSYNLLNFCIRQASLDVIQLGIACNMFHTKLLFSFATFLLLEMILSCMSYSYFPTSSNLEPFCSSLRRTAQ